MNILNHMRENIFITGAGIAALSHSTWSLGTLFSGNMPIVSGLDDYTGVAMWLYWFVPAFLIAFALDIGQINTSHQIRISGLTWQRGLTFIVFSFATYYLQFLYIAHHMPLLTVESGISAVHIQRVTQLRDAAIWLLPAILPLATFLYTLSGDTANQEQQINTQEHFEISEDSSLTNISLQELADIEILEQLSEPQIHLIEQSTILDAEHPEFAVDCICGDFNRTYDNPDSAKRGLRTHQSSCLIYQEYAESPLMQEVVS